MKKKSHSICLLLPVFLLAFGGCRDSQGELYRSFAESSAQAEGVFGGSHAPVKVEDGLNGELRVAVTWSARDDMQIGLAAQEFQELHPGVTIALEAGMTEEQQLNSDSATFDNLQLAYVQKMAVALMSGDAPDLFEVQYLGVNRYSGSGLLCNFYHFPDWDDTFPEDEYYRNLLTGCKTDRGLFALPFTVKPVAVGVNNQVAGALGVDLSAYDSIGFDQLLSLYRQAFEQGGVSEGFVYSDESTKLLYSQYELPAYLDYAERKAYLDSEEFIQYLKDLQSLDFARTAEMGGAYPSDSGFDKTTKLIADTSLTPYSVQEYFDVLDSNQATYLPYVNAEKKTVCRAGALYAIPESSQNKELAWEFLKFMLTTEVEEDPDSLYYLSRYGGDFPLKREFAEKCLEKRMGNFFREEQLEELNAVLGPNAVLTSIDSALLDALRDTFVDYFDRGLLTAEECARKLQEKAGLYFAE